MSDRVDSNGLANKGSQLQVQIYVNRHPSELATKTVEGMPALNGFDFSWVSPRQDDAFREYQDVAFLDKVALGRLAGDLRSFWPEGGPVWDGLAILDSPSSDQPGVLLLEGKSYPNELFGGGCSAESPSSKAQIEDALAWTQTKLGLVPDPELWMGRLYQNANRLAHLLWLREHAQVEAWLVHVLFLDDPHGPTSQEQWKSALREADQELGIDGIELPYAGHAYLNARDRSELLASA